tara:strand:- start:129 stop:635 length:507 start_codon:yes stop_codon:yes gene_type:complete
MDPVTIGIAIAGAKKLVETCSDIKDLSGSLEHLFSASEAKPKSKKKLSHNQKVLQQRTGEEGTDDDTSFSSVAADILAQKANEVALTNLSYEIDRKWGSGTFDLIKDERAKRIKKAKANKIEAAERSDELMDKIRYWLIESCKLIAVIVVVGLIGYYIWQNRCTSGSC